ncbi:hypothetical protein LCGC14_1909860 [marine sediment metagenome]|uniref:Uncharacterized protein n=1 Tax=marine sediment metagenome TaxID=412755 RepID=A0A0F9GH97_9ZZZZ
MPEQAPPKPKPKSKPSRAKGANNKPATPRQRRSRKEISAAQALELRAQYPEDVQVVLSRMLVADQGQMDYVSRVIHLFKSLQMDDPRITMLQHQVADFAGLIEATRDTLLGRMSDLGESFQLTAETVMSHIQQRTVAPAAPAAPAVPPLDVDASDQLLLSDELDAVTPDLHLVRPDASPPQDGAPPPAEAVDPLAVGEGITIEQRDDFIVGGLQYMIGKAGGTMSSADQHQVTLCIVDWLRRTLEDTDQRSLGSRPAEALEAHLKKNYNISDTDAGLYDEQQ